MFAPKLTDLAENIRLNGARKPIVSLHNNGLDMWADSLRDRAKLNKITETDSVANSGDMDSGQFKYVIRLACP